MTALIKLSDQLTKGLMVLAAGWAFFLTFIIITDIIGRTVFNTPIYGVPEIVMNSIVMIVFLQAGYAILSQSMLRADFLAKKLPPLIRRIVLALGYLLGAIFFLMIFLEVGIQLFMLGLLVNMKGKEHCVSQPGLLVSQSYSVVLLQQSATY